MISYIFLVYRNILSLMNTFDLPERNITGDNYDAVLQKLNLTYPEVIKDLNLETCNLNALLSEVCLLYIGRHGIHFFCQITNILCVAL